MATRVEETNIIGSHVAHSSNSSSNSFNTSWLVCMVLLSAWLSWQKPGSFLFARTFRVGFHYQHTILKSAWQILACAISHPKVMDEYLQVDVKLCQVAGPISSSNLQEIHNSKFGVIPKNHQHNKWRLIVDLSHPRNHSVYDGIPKDLCLIKYITIKNATMSISFLLYSKY